MKTSFKSVVLVAAAFASAMGCYTVSLRASTERAGVEAARQRIAKDTADIRLLQAELRTRGRLPELQRWNEQVLALAPPRAEQLLGNPVLLASYAVTPSHAAVEVAAVVRDAPALAAAPIRQVAYVAPRVGRDLASDATTIGNLVSDAMPAGFQKIALR